jgi:DNA (cytosine-5)-methyltransferase 1
MSGAYYKILDLFAGAGGFSYGFKKLSYNGHYPFIISGAVEMDKYAADTFKSALIRDGMFPRRAEKIVINEDITENETLDMLYEVCPEADIIIGGPPCQSFSLIGPRSGDPAKKKRFVNDHRDDLFHEYVKIVKHYKPLIFVFENVKGIVSKKSKDNEKYINLIVKSLEDIGYDLGYHGSDSKYMLLNAADYGVPQLRERFFIIGNKIGIKNSIPPKTHCPADMVEKTGLKPYVTVRAALGDLPVVLPKITYTRNGNYYSGLNNDQWKRLIDNENQSRESGEDISEYHHIEFMRHYSNCNESERQYIDYIKPKDFNTPLIGHSARSHQLSDIKLYKNLPEGFSSADLIESEDPELNKLAELIKYRMDSFKDKYKKMAWDKPSLTVFAHLQKDGNRFIHPDSKQARTITVREAARLQSFPDDYEFKAKGNVRFKHIGNAVPPILATSIAKAIYGALHKYESK